MKLPSMPYGSGIRKAEQVQFKGLNHNLGAGDGELWDMRNLTGDYAPLLATRRKRRTERILSGPNGLFCWEGLCWVDGTTFYYQGTAKGTVSDTEKRFAALGAYIIILPDKKYYNVESGEFGSLESEWSLGGGTQFRNDTLYGEEAACNCLRYGGVVWDNYFRVGDAVTISGCTLHPENNKTAIIREIDGDKLLFYENTFVLGGAEGTTDYTETARITIKRTVPDLLFLCENENRLWGCDERTIYASKLGDPFNWNVYDGLSTDSYAVDTGSAGTFTGCISYLGYPVFFKEDHIYKVFGSMPSNFEVMGSATLGVKEGSDKSLAVAGENLYYLSTAGFMVYQGGIPRPVGQALGLEKYRDAVAGSDGLKYYVSARGNDMGCHLFVYDTQRGMWHTEDETAAVGFCRHDGETCLLAASGELLILDSGEPNETDFDWYAEFGDFTDDSPNKKGVSKIQIRLELEEGATCSVKLRFDSVGEWITAGELETDVKRSYYLPIIPRRGDHYRLRLEGTGGCRVYSITRERYHGSELKSRQGRN